MASSVHLQLRLARQMINIGHRLPRFLFLYRHHILPSRCFGETRIMLADDEGKIESPKLELSHPTKKKRVQDLADDSSSSSSSSESDSDSDSELAAAVDQVAGSIEGDPSAIASDLLMQLQNHRQLTEDKKAEQIPTMDLSDLMGGMKISKRRPGDQGKPDSPGQLTRGRMSARPRRQAGQGEGDVMSQVMGHAHRDNRQMQQNRNRYQVNLKLFTGPALGIFTQPSSNIPAVQSDVSKFGELEKQQMSKNMSLPPENPIVEQIQWTEEGKLWQFPVDNEQGMDEERDVPFHEHIFLDAEIADFPKRGPVRHFMELVCVGLSKNAYLTVAEKKEHINWFRNYFADKKHILDEVLVEQDNSLEAKSS